MLGRGYHNQSQSASQWKVRTPGGEMILGEREGMGGRGWLAYLRNLGAATGQEV